MLTILGQNTNRGFCDRLSRRSFLQIGSLAMGGLAMSDVLRAEAAGSPRRNKSVIMIFLPGGPPHQDMYDLKPDAPSEVRGEFQPIKTNVPGIEICELLPRMAGMMDKLVPIRTMVGATGDHYSFQCMTGRDHRRQPPGGWPEFGSVVARLQGSASPCRRTSACRRGCSTRRTTRASPASWARPMRPSSLMATARMTWCCKASALERLGDRAGLVRALDNFNRTADSTRMMEGMDAFEQQAFGVLTSSRLAEALDVEREPQAVRDRYGVGTEQHQGDGAPRLMQQFLMARRLVEAGVRCVTVSFSFWDYHGSNFALARQNLPPLDQGVSALVEDLYQRGLDQDTTVIVWGEFGRTPKINAQAGRDHWPNVSCALLAGGGLRTGQVIGTY